MKIYPSWSLHPDAFTQKIVFDPITIATALGASASTAATIGTVATVASVVLPVLGAVKGNKEAKAQASEFTRQATEARVASSIEAEKLRRKNRIKQSSDRVSFAEGGALSGTAFGVLDQNAVAQELDALTVEFRGEQQGTSADFQAQQARKSASPLNVLTAGIGALNQVDPLNLPSGGGSVFNPLFGGKGLGGFT